jgi:hypothetical protein
VVKAIPHYLSAPTPAIDALLRRLRARLLREVWIFGLGRTGLVLSVCLLFAFLIDWTLHVPSGVRLLHFAILLVLPAVVLWRDLLGRLRRIPDASGLAILIERAHPELHELLVSAVQLRSCGPAGEHSEIDPALIERVVAEAEARAPTLDLAHASDPRPPRAALALGALGALAALSTFALQRDAAGIFFARIAGGSTPWPQHTHLSVEIPLAGELYSSSDELALAVARGSDLPIVVRAQGQVPDEVRLIFEDGPEALLGSAGRDAFRTLLRSVQEDLVFHVEGGDDRDGTPRVRIRVLQPPDVSRLAVHVVPPAYSGLPERLEFDRDVQVLYNSRLEVHMLPSPPDAHGIARLLPEDVEHELRRAPFPPFPSDGADGAGAAGPDGAEPLPLGLLFELAARESLRYRFELQDSTGLANPDPGLFSIEVVNDRAPEVDLLSPTRGEIESVIGGALPLKLIASDDFGLGQVRWRSVATSAADGPTFEQELETSAPAAPQDLRARPGGRALAFATRRIEIDELFGGKTPSEGEVFQIDVSAADNRQPSPQETRSAPVRLRVVSADEFLRRIQDRLARVRSKVEALATLIADKQSYTRDLLASLESDEPGRADSSGVHSALTGARRVEGDAKALSREVASIAEALLYSRLDDRADALLAELERGTAAIADRNFHAQPWLELSALQAQGRLGKADFADRLVEIVGVSLAISEVDSPGAIDDLRRAQDLADIGAQHDSLLRVLEQQTAARAKTERLLSLLSEWDSYQSLLSATRDILTRQKTLLERTRQYYKDN